MVRFEDLISRADTAWLQEQVGSSVVRVLQALDQKNQRVRMMREIFLNLNDPRDLLTKPTICSKIFELLRPAEAAQLAAVMKEFGGSYSGLSDLKLRRGSEKYELCCAFFGLPAMPPNETQSTPSVARATALYSLFPHQRKAVSEVCRLLNDGGRRVVLHMPTGAGKTRMAMHVVAQRLAAQDKSIVTWLANSEELCEQAAEEFLSAWRHLGNRDLDIYRFWGERQLDFCQLSDGLVIGGFSKLYSLAQNSLPSIAVLGDKTSLVVVDEAHQAIAPTYRLLIDGLTARHSDMSVLGLTATPGRTWNDPEADRRLAEYFSRTKVTLDVPGFDSPIDFLIDQGFLAKPTFRQIEHVSEEISHADLTRLATDLDMPKSILVKLAADEMRTLKIVSEIEQLVQRHRRIICFATTVEHAVVLAAVLDARDIEARTVTGQTGNHDRAASIAWFKQNTDSPRVLMNFGVLTTGFDAPMTSAVLIARPTKSLVLYSQMVGRAIRGPRAGGNQHAEIVTVVDTQLPGFGNLSLAFTNWEDVW